MDASIGELEMEKHAAKECCHGEEKGFALYIWAVTLITLGFWMVVREVWPQLPFGTVFLALGVILMYELHAHNNK
ncbi:Uncharacterised protein [uncultured archaeon]|nr:Uncharacterised protein [uncultured archaeon]